MRLVHKALDDRNWTALRSFVLTHEKLLPSVLPVRHDADNNPVLKMIKHLQGRHFDTLNEVAPVTAPILTRWLHQSRLGKYFGLKPLPRDSFEEQLLESMDTLHVNLQKVAARQDRVDRQLARLTAGRWDAACTNPTAGELRLPGTWYVLFAFRRPLSRGVCENHCVR